MSALGASRARATLLLRLLWLWGALALLGAAPAGAEGPAAAETSDREWADALSLVDQLAWSRSDAFIRRYIQRAARPDAVFSASWRQGLEDQGRRLVGATVYAVEARLEPSAVVDLRQAVVWTNRSRRPVDRVVLRFLPGTDPGAVHGLAVHVQGQPVAWWMDESLLEVALPEAVPPGGRARLLLTARVIRIPPFHPWERMAPEVINTLEVGAFGRANGVINLGYWLPLVTPIAPDGTFDRRPIPRNGEHAWFDPAHFHVLLDVPESHQVASTGVEIGRRGGDGRQTLRLVAAGVREFAVEAGAQLTFTQAEQDGITVRVLHHHKEPQVGEDLLAYALDALRFFEARWGPLPYRELDLVDAPVRVALGLEFPQLVTVATRHRPGPYQPSEDHRHTVAHEIAHQWWYAEVGSDPREEPWVDEALAVHSSLLYTEHASGVEAARARQRQDLIRPYEQLVSEGIGVLPASLPSDRYDLRQYSILIYGKAALFLEQVRRALGDDRYHQALRRYHQSHRLKNATGEDLLDAMRSAAPEPAEVDRLYRLWMDEVHHYDDLLPPP